MHKIAPRTPNNTELGPGICPNLQIHQNNEVEELGPSISLKIQIHQDGDEI
jgi:hypothetical protein